MADKDALVYPTDQVVGIVEDPAALDQVLDALREVDAGDDDVTVLRGHEDADLEPDPSQGGPIKTVVRAAQQILGDEAERLRQLDEALTAGHVVVGVGLGVDPDDDEAAEDRKQRLGRALNGAGARDVAFYGEYQIEQLDLGATS